MSESTGLKGNPNRAHDYVCDIERWTYHARHHLKGYGNSRPARSEQAMLALANALAAVNAAMEYIRTGEEQPYEVVR
jgi:hypothetical protein